jgi:TPR repeat protein
MKRAAEQGAADAQFEMGRCYAEGMGVPENPEDAAKYYQRSAEQNYAPGQYALGNCYFEGYGVSKEVPEGVEWTRRAAEQGYAPAENVIGLCYSKGKGVKQDYVEAYKWFDLAVAQSGEHNNDARINLSMAERAMTPDQIAQGQKLAQEFKPRVVSSPGSAHTANTAKTASEGAKMGILNVNADEETGEVFVDGAFVGNAPAKLKLEPGLHVVEVKKPGFKDYRKALKISEGSELTLRAVLERQ